MIAKVRRRLICRATSGETVFVATDTVKADYEIIERRFFVHSNER